MPQATRKPPLPMPFLASGFGRGAREGLFIAFAASALFLLLSFWSYNHGDPGWSFSGGVGPVENHGGVVGAWLADVFLYLFGYLAYLFPVLVVYAGLLIFKEPAASQNFTVGYLLARGGGFAMALAGGSALATLHYGAAGGLPLDAGGILGNVVGRGLVSLFNFLGATLILLSLFLTGLTLFLNLSWIDLMDRTGRWTLIAAGYLYALPGRYREKKREAHEAETNRRLREVNVELKRKQSKRKKPPRIEPTIEVQPSLRVEKEKQTKLFEEKEGTLPPLSLLDEPESKRKGVSESALEAMSRQVELKLKDYGVDAEVVAVHPGPVVTRFELQLAPGIKVSRVSGLARDLARSLAAVSVRIVEVIPGKSVIGLELPNEEVEIVRLSEILRSEGYDAMGSHLALALGKDIAGNSLVVDLARMPHLLVAGTTGSGKSVAINAMVLSLLYKATAKDVRLIMIDPKMLELSVYEGIPHLLAPVVTDMKDAGNALRWCVAEMERRYKLMSRLGVRNVAGFNRKVTDAEAKGKPISDPFFEPGPLDDPPPAAPPLEPMPQIVVIVDELADLMMTTGKKVEELIARLAQKARAAGVHLILATQRPSVDVITGLIKANIPSRIAFQVSSKVDSRTILDQGGAEQLLGHGDMLHLTPGMPAPIRIHGAFVGDQEVHRVVEELKKQGAPQYVDEIIDGIPEGSAVDGMPGFGADEADSEADPLYDDAVRIVTESRKASISGVQRRLKIGYNRAARMIEHMEAVGLVGPLQSNGAREVIAPPPPEA